MAEKAFLQIKQTEAQAQNIIKVAHEKAAQIIEHSKEQTADTFLGFSEKCKQQALQERQQLKSNIREKSNAFMEETGELSHALKQKLLLQKAKAIDVVIQLITL